ncbi:hypothetical protein CHLNCDRAFT_139592 [Chlorella variabilis]|uniref:Hydroxyproline O-arabinosyltransferase-like domain-containing protein n=1 Tax=Chlorella variabilis TaxID=554065 RepID=E1ZQH3_CHLVA|nr:hypothetical protein CHLNCDRAFT_139592 [Chlorella variabilis]EFN52021.1 hypothetical protein CHLNCDRAFT_139592 [Chlorella variabilis]|eukprot:XP_005844123.1 hypothetical protein CHLNCDRAFT_139592 [Chlorella variabilis]
MGRKSDAARFQAMGRGGKPITRARILTFLAAGFLVGLGLGFVFMGTVHANLIMFGTYKLVQKMPGGDKMVAFTRILHRTTQDALSPRVPTFLAKPLHPECDAWCDYPVADRPNAIRQFLDAARADPGLIRAPWLYMIETDFIEGDEECKKALDWVREMYAFSVAAALEKIPLDMHEPPDSVTMIQPPADARLGKAHLMHYTWGAIFNAPNGTKEWEFDKRFYTEPKHEEELPKIPPPPPFREGWKLQDGLPVTRDLYDVIAQMIDTMNRGIDAEGLA